MTTATDFQDNHPFISCIKTGDQEIVGIIINFDDFITSIYDISVLRTVEEKRMFLEAGETWWWESNRQIPINIFLKQEMSVFRYCVRNFNSKDVELVFGPRVNLSEIAKKRIKRKSIQLIRIPKSFRA
jgi:hypothetical protein